MDKFNHVHELSNLCNIMDGTNSHMCVTTMEDGFYVDFIDKDRKTLCNFSYGEGKPPEVGVNIDLPSVLYFALVGFASHCEGTWYEFIDERNKLEVGQSAI